jgi:hypothetical protein
MDLRDFTESLKGSMPPDVSGYLKALWHDAKGDWNTAHQLADKIGDKKAAWIHAYLHRKEGDISNADYWYSRAGKKRPSVSLDEEWEELAEFFLNDKL